MSFDLARIKRIDNRQKLTVFGYLREACDVNIIDLICYICLSFYASLQTFSRYSQYLKLSGYDNNTLRGHVCETDADQWCSAFGETWIESTSSDIIKWEIKLNNDGSFDHGHFGIGVISNQHKQDVDRDADSMHCYFYYFYYSYGCQGVFKVDGKYNEEHDGIDKLHRKIASGDTIHFILNMGSTKLCYYLNDEESNVKVLTNSIKTGKDLKYAFAISMVPRYITCSISVTQKFIS